MKLAGGTRQVYTMGQDYNTGNYIHLFTFGV